MSWSNNGWQQEGRRSSAQAWECKAWQAEVRDATEHCTEQWGQEQQNEGGNGWRKQFQTFRIDWNLQKMMQSHAHQHKGKGKNNRGKTTETMSTQSSSSGKGKDNTDKDQESDQEKDAYQDRSGLLAPCRHEPASQYQTQEASGRDADQDKDTDQDNDFDGPGMETFPPDMVVIPPPDAVPKTSLQSTIQSSGSSSWDMVPDTLTLTSTPSSSA